jgi:hypothetical protein
MIKHEIGFVVGSDMPTIVAGYKPVRNQLPPMSAAHDNPHEYV